MIAVPERGPWRGCFPVPGPLTSSLKVLSAPVSLICWLCATITTSECISKENQESLSAFTFLDISSWFCLMNFPSGFLKLRVEEAASVKFDEVLIWFSCVVWVEPNLYCQLVDSVRRQGHLLVIVIWYTTPLTACFSSCLGFPSYSSNWNVLIFCFSDV